MAIKDYTRKKMFKSQNRTIVNSSTQNETIAEKPIKVIKYNRKDWLKDRFKEVNAMIMVAFLWLVRISFVPSLLLVGSTWFATNIMPTVAIQVYSTTSLKESSPLMDQFAFFYLPLISFVFIFGVVVAIFVCYTEYVFWKKCGVWIKYWFKRTGIKNPFKSDKKEQVK